MFTFTGLLWHFKADEKLFQLLSYHRSSNKPFVVQKVLLTPLRALAVLYSEKNRKKNIMKYHQQNKTQPLGSHSLVLLCLLQHIYCCFP